MTTHIQPLMFFIIVFVYASIEFSEMKDSFLEITYMFIVFNISWLQQKNHKSQKQIYKFTVHLSASWQPRDSWFRVMDAYDRTVNPYYPNLKGDLRVLEISNQRTLFHRTYQLLCGVVWPSTAHNNNLSLVTHMQISADYFILLPNYYL